MSEPQGHGASPPRIALSLGSNLGDRVQMLRQAIMWLKPHLDIFAISALYHTQPWGKTDQPAFLNACLLAQTPLAPLQVLTLIKTCEQALGRVTTEKWGPRLIDIDLLVMEGVSMAGPTLTLPHPHMHLRAFVLVPLAEIAGEWLIDGVSIADMLAQLPRQPDDIWREPPSNLWPPA